MKKILLTLLLGILSAGTQAATYDWGAPDTLEHYPIGPGAVYTYTKYSKKVLNVHMVTLDLTHPYLHMELFPSNGKTPDLSRENVTDQCRRNSTSGHRAFAGVNHDFFSYTGTAITSGTNARDGEIVNSLNVGRSTLAISKDKRASVFPTKFQANIIFEDATTLAINNINSSNNGVSSSHNCVLFNPMCAIQLTLPGTYVKIRPISEWVINGQPTSCVVEQISDQVIPLDRQSHILYLRNTPASTFTSKAVVGDTIKIEQLLVQTTFPYSKNTGVPSSDILQVASGYPCNVFAGELQDAENANYTSSAGRENWDYPCTQVGVSQDGTKMWMVVIDKATMIEIGLFLRDLGAYHVVNFDGGGSTLMSIDYVLVNNPADGKERQVMDSFQAISSAPSDTTISSISFKRPYIELPEAALWPLSLIGNNTYGEVQARDFTNVTFSCSDSIGFVDTLGVFHAYKGAKEGKITAQYNGKTCVTRVKVVPVENIKLVPTTITIDSRRSCPINMETLYRSYTLTLDPNSFTWSVADPSICTIENGVVKGLKTGKTTIRANIDYLAPLEVTVEVGKDEITVANYPSSVDKLTTSGFSNTRLSTTQLPSNWSNGTSIFTTLGTSRAPFFEISEPITFFGLPDSISWEQQLPGTLVNEMQVFLQSNLEEKFREYVLPVISDQTERFVINFKDLDIDWRVIDFPITLNRIKWVCNGAATKQEYMLSIKDLKAYYPEKSPTDVPNTTLQRGYIYHDSSNRILHVVVDQSELDLVKLSVTTLNGQRIVSAAGNVLSTANWPKGVYLVTIQQSGSSSTHKIVIK